MKGSPILLVSYKDTTVNYFSLLEVEFENNLIKGIKSKSEVPLFKGHG